MNTLADSNYLYTQESKLCLDSFCTCNNIHDCNCVCNLWRPARTYFSKISGFATLNFIGVSRSAKNKNVNKLQVQTQTDGRKERRKNRQTLFHRTLLATVGGPTSITAVDRHLKVKDTEYDAGLTKNCCITTSLQKISSIHKLNLKICRF